MIARELRIDVPDDFDYEENIAYLARSPKECMHVVHDGAVLKRIPIGSTAPLVRLTGSNNAPLLVQAYGRTDLLNVEQAEAIARYVREWFDLDNDMKPFYAMAREDAILNNALDRHRGLRIIGIPDLFEAICWGILGQQINLTFAYTIKQRFVEQFGHAEEHEGIAYWTFPEPTTIAALTPEDLTPLQLTMRKAEYVIGVARQIAEGALSKRMLLEAGSAREAERLLVSIRGIGPWTANYVLMRCLRYPDAFPIDDVGLHNALRSILGLPEKPSIRRIRELASGWRGWESYATFYLWRMLY